MTPTHEQALQIYRTMLRIRAFEAKASKLFLTGRLPGFLHTYIGQEAVAAGVCVHLTREDTITNTHRGQPSGRSVPSPPGARETVLPWSGRAVQVCLDRPRGPWL